MEYQSSTLTPPQRVGALSAVEVGLRVLVVLVDLDSGLMAAAAALLEGEVAKSRGVPPQLPRTPPQRGQGQVLMEKQES